MGIWEMGKRWDWNFGNFSFPREIATIGHTSVFTAASVHHFLEQEEEDGHRHGHEEWGRQACRRRPEHHPLHRRIRHLYIIGKQCCEVVIGLTGESGVGWVLSFLNSPSASVLRGPSRYKSTDSIVDSRHEHEFVLVIEP